jgi:CBS domain-containing protein
MADLIAFSGEGSAASFFYIVKQGAVDLSLSYNEKEILVDKCDEGDIVGL